MMMLIFSGRERLGAGSGRTEPPPQYGRNIETSLDTVPGRWNFHFTCLLKAEFSDGNKFGVIVKI